MESIFSKAHKDNMIMEIKLFRMMKEEQKNGKLLAFHSQVKNPKLDYFDKMRLI